MPTQYPKRFYRQRARTRPPKAIILHSCSCSCNFPSLKIDTPKVQQVIVRESNIIIDMEPDCIYHYICELVNNDYEVFIERPFTYLADFASNNPIFTAAIHVGIVGDYNIRKPVSRLYDVLAYRLLAPLLYQFNLSIEKVYRHIDLDPHADCPLKLFDMAYLKQRLQTFQVHQ